MKIIYICGGIGNQLFQYAFARKMQIITRDIVKIDSESFFNIFKERQIKDSRSFLLSSFNCLYEEASINEINQIRNRYGFFSKVIRKLSNKFVYNYNVTYKPDIFQKKGDRYVEGYWQSPNYFADIREILLKELTPVNPLPQAALVYLNKIVESQSVSLHIRRGDYLSSSVIDRYGACSLSYYFSAMKIMKEAVKNPYFFIFSDDIDWAIENFNKLDGNLIFIKNKELTDIEELLLMSSCKHNIIANSTFSWWAAWLNKNDEKKVIAPDPWFDKEPYDRDLIPKSWLKIQK